MTLYQGKCCVCGKRASRPLPPKEAEQAAKLAGFLVLEFPQPNYSYAHRVFVGVLETRTTKRAFCPGCTKHLRTHFISSNPYAQASDVLQPEDQDVDFENDKGW